MSRARTRSSTRTQQPHTDGWWEDVVDICSRLIRIDTQLGGPGERAAAEWVAEFLDEAAVTSQLVESEPGRSTLVARVPGQDPTLDPLLVQIHLDVVPAQPHEWRVHPLSGEVADGYVWGRGAVDMKNMIAAVLTVVRHRMHTERLPRRPLVLAFFADEENAGALGAEWAVRHRPDLFEGCRVAIGECGGWSLPLRPDLRVYPIPVAEKGWAALEVSARAQPAHASRVYDENPVRVLGEAVGRLTHDRFPIHLTPQIEQLLRLACDAHGGQFSSADPEAALPLLGFAQKNAASGLRHLAHATRLSAGYRATSSPAPRPRSWTAGSCPAAGRSSTRS